MIEETLNFLKQEKLDYTNFFRNLNGSIFGDKKLSLQEKLRKRFEFEEISQDQHQEIVKANNPKFILRNYLAQVAIEKAEKGDFSEVNKLLEILKNPFVDHKGLDDYAKESPEWGKNLEISCSS